MPAAVSTRINPQIWRHRGLFWLLFLLLTLRIVSYFTLFPDSVGLTRMVKIGLRLVLSGGVWWAFLVWRKRLAHRQFAYLTAIPLGLYGVYLLLGLVSLFWSSDVYYSGIQWFMIVENLLFVWAFWHLYLLYTSEFPRAPSFAAMLGFAVGAVLIWMLLGGFFDPDKYYRQTHGGEVSRIGGYLMNPNELGMLAGVGVAGVYSEWKRGQTVVLGGLVWLLCGAVLFMSMSRSSMMGFAAMTGIVAMTSGGFKLRFGMILTVFAMLPLFFKYLTLKGDAAELASGTGRLPFWSDLLTDGFPQKPCFGFGFMQISTHEKFDSLHSYAASMSHNTFVQVIMNLGIAGIVIVFFQMIALFLTLVRASSGVAASLKMLAWLMLLPLLINSMSEFGIFGESNYSILFYQFILLFVTVKIYENG
jgi:exopolysaccharide production protein ExoQ